MRPAAPPGPIEAAPLPEPGPGRDPDAARRRAEEILSSAEFDDARSVPERVLDWIGERLADLAGGLGPGGGSAVLGLLVLAAIVAVAALAVWALRARQRLARPGAAPVGEPEVRVSRLVGDDVDWWRETADAERDGRWGDAVRAAYRATAGDLARAGVVEDPPSATAGEQRRRLGESSPGLAGDFESLAGRFEAVWYGAAVPGEQEGRAATGQARRLVGHRADGEESISEGRGGGSRA